MKKNLFGHIFILMTFLLLFSCKTAKLSDAVAKEELGEYYDAAQIYRRVYSKTPSKNKPLKSSIAFHMADCYRFANNTSRALNAYQNAIRYKYQDSTAILYAAQMFHKSGKYGEAVKFYKEFLTKEPENELARNGIFGCEQALLWKKNPTRYVVKKQDKLNSRRGEFSPMLTGDKFDQLYIASSRDDAIGEGKSAVTGLKNNDFFLSKKNEKGEWQAPDVLEEGLNTEFDEGSCSFSKDGSTMYYTFCSQEMDVPRTAQIYKSTRSGGKWSKGQRVEIFKDTLRMAAHPSVSPDGKYLYFVSDQGGIGGKDIWRVSLTGTNTGSPENLGPEINTPGDEMFPYVRDSVTLYFASNGHPGMGGLDIFKATRQKRGTWKVENMQVPINSQSDDFGITFAGNNEYGFFSSNRNDGRGTDHIYSFELPVITVYVDGWVLDKDQEPIEGATVRLVGKDGTNEKFTSRKDGSYFSIVKLGTDYVMMASAPGYLNQNQTLSIASLEENKTYYVDFSLASISKPVPIDNIFYDFNKATLRPESKKALDELIQMLEDNPNVTIELMAHTDRKGSQEYNRNLSQKRAQSVVDYLIQNGIDKERLTAMGYGKLQPKTITKKLAEKYDFLPEETVLTEEFIQYLTPEQQEIADQINRRTEFRVLSVTYNLF